MATAPDGANTAQVLEYDSDFSQLSDYERPIQALPHRPQIIAADVAIYAGLGIHHLATFAVRHDAEYVRRLGTGALLDWARRVA